MRYDPKFMEPLHISEGDLAKDIRSILKRVETGSEVIVERDAQPVAVIRAAEPVRRKISECIARLPPIPPRRSILSSRRMSSRYRRPSRAAGAARLGLMLDSTAAVAAERQGKNARQLLESVALETGDEAIAVSVVTVLELAHGITRADTIERRERRQRFLDELLIGVPIQPVTVPIALRAGQIDGQSRATGAASRFRICSSGRARGSLATESGRRTPATFKDHRPERD
jgi:predicted nucleic acid-binding protein